MATLWVVFAVYLLLVLLLGEVCARLKIRSLDDYLLAGRRHGPWITAGTLAATVIGAGSTLGAAGVAYFAGLSAAWYLLSASVGLVLLGFTLAPALRGLSLYTVPGYIDRRYGPTAGLLAGALGVVGLVLFLAAQLYAMGALVAQLFGVSLPRAIVLSSLVVILYTWRGGNWAVHWSDNVQLLWIFAGIVIACWSGIAAVGGIGALADPPAPAGFEALGSTWFDPLRLEAVGGWDLFALGDTVLAWVIMSTTWHFAMQSTAQRVLSARDPGTARSACLAAAVILIPLALMIALSGMAARILYPELPTPSGIEQATALPALVRGLLSPALAGVVLAALVAAIMSTCDSVLLGASTLLVKDVCPRIRRPGILLQRASPAGATRTRDVPGGEFPVGATRTRDVPSGGSPAGAARTRNSAGGTRPAGGLQAPDLAAGRSSAAGATTQDVASGGFPSGAGDLAGMRLAQRLTLVTGLAGMGIALVTPTLVRMLEMVAAVYCVALFPPLLLGLYWPRANGKGAVLAMVSSGMAGLAWRGLGVEEDTGIHMLNVSLPLSVVALIAGSLIAGRDKPRPRSGLSR